MPLIEIYHRSTEGWSRYEPSRNGYEQITGPMDETEDAPRPGYYLSAGDPYPFAGPFASLDAAKERFDIEMRYRDAVEKYERARDAARDALYGVAALLTGSQGPYDEDSMALVRGWFEVCDDPDLLPHVPETASDYFDSED